MSAQINQQTSVLIQLHIAALLLGGTAQFSKLIPLPAVDIISYRTLFCGAIVLAIALALRNQIKPNSIRDGVLILISSVLFAVHWFTYFHAMQVSSVAIGIVSMFTFPVLTVFIEAAFTKKPISRFDLTMGLLVLMGVVIMTSGLELGSQVVLGVFFGLISAFAVSFRNVIVGQYLSGYSPLTLMAYHGFISFLVTWPFTSSDITQINPASWLLILLLASLFTAVPHTQITHGLQHYSAKKVSMIISLQVVYAALIAYLLLSETLSWGTVVGGTCILCAALGESLRKKT